MASYFDSFGPVPLFSRHAWRRVIERDISLAALHQALQAEARLGTSPETVIYQTGGVTAVVRESSGIIVTIWSSA